MQAGGGNSANNSVGAVQVGATHTSPSLDARVAGSTLHAGLTAGIAGNGNNANDSIGTVQLGGGNNAENSLLSVQSGAAAVAAEIAATLPFGQTTATVPLTIGDTGSNSATDSIGTAQIGGGNTASDSVLTIQSAPITAGPALDSTTPVGPVSGSAPVSIGSGSGGNTATDSIGTVQLGGGNNSSGSAGTVQVGSTSTSPSVGGGGTNPSSTPSTTSGPSTQSTPGASSAPQSSQAPVTTSSHPASSAPATRTHGVLGASASVVHGAAAQLAGAAKLGQLPFTGLALWLFALLGLALSTLGLRVRAYAR